MQFLLTIDAPFLHPAPVPVMPLTLTKEIAILKRSMNPNGKDLLLYLPTDRNQENAAAVLVASIPAVLPDPGALDPVALTTTVVAAAVVVAAAA